MGTSETRGRSQLPLAAVLGHLYVARSTGHLSVFDSEATSQPFMQFWFKYGVPCYSVSKESSTRLGALLPSRARSTADRLAKKGHDSGHGPLLGQLLIAEKVLTIEELNRALVEQISRRLLTCAAMSKARFEFEAGYDSFAGVPLSSPPVSPLELAARCALLAPVDAVQGYLSRKIRSEKVILTNDRRLPAFVKDQLSGPALEMLSNGAYTSQLMETPSLSRTLCFVASFGYLQSAQGAPHIERPAPAPMPEPALPNAPERSLGAMELATNHYSLLGLPLDASAADIRRRYRDLALRIHPDRVAPHERSQAQGVFSRLVEAHDVLTKESRRLRYDEELIASGEWRTLGTMESTRIALEARSAALKAGGVGHDALRYSSLAQWLDQATQTRWAMAHAWA